MCFRGSSSEFVPFNDGGALSSVKSLQTRTSVTLGIELRPLLAVPPEQPSSSIGDRDVPPYSSGAYFEVRVRQLARESFDATVQTLQKSC
ncbi:hypothetical protein D3C81_1004030 [compost metagenome]